MTLTGGEPLYQPDFAVGILELCRIKKIHTAIETSLFADKDIVRMIVKLTDLVFADMKIFDPVLHKEFTGQRNETIKENLQMLLESGVIIIVRVPIVENITDSRENIEAITDFVRKTGRNIPIEFIEYNPLAGNNYRKLGIPFKMKACSLPR